MLDDVNWSSITDNPDINICWREWQSTFLNIMSECIPKKKLPSKKTFHGYLMISLGQWSWETNYSKPIKEQAIATNSPSISLPEIAWPKRSGKPRRDFLKALTPPIQKPTGNCSRHLSRKVIHSYASCSWLQLVTDNKEKANILNPVSASNFNQSYSTLNPDQTDYSIPPRAEFPEALLCTEEQVFQLGTVSKALLRSKNTEHSCPAVSRAEWQSWVRVMRAEMADLPLVKPHWQGDKEQLFRKWSDNR